MTGGQIAALVIAVILLLPGGCFLLVGIGFATDGGSAAISDSSIFFVIAGVILIPAGLLFWAAFRKRRPPVPPGADPTA